MSSNDSIVSDDANPVQRRVRDTALRIRNAESIVSDGVMLAQSRVRDTALHIIFLVL